MKQRSSIRKIRKEARRRARVEARRNRLPGTFWGRIKYMFQRRILSGLFVVVPLSITIFVLKFLYDFTVGRLSPIVKQFLSTYPDYAVALASIVILVALLYFVGLVASVVLGRRLIYVAERIIQRIPLVKTVYMASKQMVEALSFQDAGANLRTAAYVEFPFRGMRGLGFVTGKVALADGQTYYKVFIPTVPNISVGLFQLVPPQDVYHAGISTEEALRVLMSVGILGPEKITLTPISEVTLGLPEKNAAGDGED